MVKNVVVNVTVGGWAAQVGVQPALVPLNACRWAGGRTQTVRASSTMSALQDLFDLVYNGNGAFLRSFHRQVNGDPGV
jgi:hypothetical protein